MVNAVPIAIKFVFRGSIYKKSSITLLLVPRVFHGFPPLSLSKWLSSGSFMFSRYRPVPVLLFGAALFPCRNVLVGGVYVFLWGVPVAAAEAGAPPRRVLSATPSGVQLSVRCNSSRRGIPGPPGIIRPVFVRLGNEKDIFRGGEIRRAKASDSGPANIS